MLTKPWPSTAVVRITSLGTFIGTLTLSPGEQNESIEFYKKYTKCMNCRKRMTWFLICTLTGSATGSLNRWNSDIEDVSYLGMSRWCVRSLSDETRITGVIKSVIKNDSRSRSIRISIGRLRLASMSFSWFWVLLSAFKGMARNFDRSGRNEWLGGSECGFGCLLNGWSAGFKVELREGSVGDDRKRRLVTVFFVGWWVSLRLLSDHCPCGFDDINKGACFDFQGGQCPRGWGFLKCFGFRRFST